MGRIEGMATGDEVEGMATGDDEFEVHEGCAVAGSYSTE